MIKIKIEYNSPEPDAFEIRFLRGNNLIHNVSYNISGLNEDEILELKKEAVAEFCTVFPDVPLKAVLQGFNAVDPLMYEYYRQVFPNGGKRTGAGRPKGAKSSNSHPERNIYFYKKVTAEEKKFLSEMLKKYRSGEVSGLKNE